ncbi:hypothetical protein P154DRAFT_567037 [Amniculicola lignicola CBS 123094]|uniref:Uncharacterized protein n=1 Tax=Amniculicola lignicola CBS 123094 TaxID=1392246 RepID=A0A6A5VZQ7_9PLEO|nr:hypothetical protein P154DRAFT_567037 [Amniculicola lignicola CBS 123094]
MPSKPQSPDPHSTLPQTLPRKPRPKTKEVESASARAGSAGGILLFKEQAGSKGTNRKKEEGTMSSKPQAKQKTTSAPSKEVQKDAPTPEPASASTGPNRQRRRPRKLVRDPVTETQTTVPAEPTAVKPTGTSQTASTTELEALKSRVRGLEAKVEELYNSGATGQPARSPRRRGKGRKGSSATQVPTMSTLDPSTPRVEEVVEEEEEADEELERLEDELEVARRDLEAYGPSRARPRSKRTTSRETEYVEEIPRGAPGVEVMSPADRQVTLTGSYRIPLPTSVNMEDVKTIQSGVTAAQNVARSFLEQRRARQAAGATQVPSSASPPTVAPKSKPKAKSKGKQPVSSTVAEAGKQSESDQGQSWGEWFGGYSMAITRAVKTIEADAALESQKGARPAARRPAQVSRTASAASAKGTAKTTGKTGTGQRPPLKARQGNLSSEQVRGLMN